MLIQSLILFASLGFGQISVSSGTETIDEIRRVNLAKSVRDLQSGKPTITGTPTYQNGICFGDSTCFTGLSSSPTVSGQITLQNPLISAAVYTSTNVASGATIATDTGSCITSTRTITTYGNPLWVYASGVATPGQTQYCFHGWVLLDGEPLPGYTSAQKNISFCQGATTNYNQQLSYGRLVSVSAGAHTLCWNFHADAAVTLPGPIDWGAFEIR